MTGSHLLLLKSKLNSGIFKSLLDLIGLIAYDHDRLFSLNPVQGEINGIGKHGNAEKGMKNLHQIGLHPGPLARSKNNRRNPFQSLTIINKSYQFYTMPEVDSQPYG